MCYRYVVNALPPDKRRADIYLDIYHSPVAVHWHALACDDFSRKLWLFDGHLPKALASNIIIACSKISVNRSLEGGSRRMRAEVWVDIMVCSGWWSGVVCCVRAIFSILFVLISHQWAFTALPITTSLPTYLPYDLANSRLTARKAEVSLLLEQPDWQGTPSKRCYQHGHQRSESLVYAFPIRISQMSSVQNPRPRRRRSLLWSSQRLTNDMVTQHLLNFKPRILFFELSL